MYACIQVSLSALTPPCFPLIRRFFLLLFISGSHLSLPCLVFLLRSTVIHFFFPSFFYQRLHYLSLSFSLFLLTSVCIVIFRLLLIPLLLSFSFLLFISPFLVFFSYKAYILEPVPLQMFPYMQTTIVLTRFADK